MLFLCLSILRMIVPPNVFAKEEYVSQMLFGIPPCAAFTSTFTFSEDLKISFRSIISIYLLFQFDVFSAFYSRITRLFCFLRNNPYCSGSLHSISAIFVAENFCLRDDKPRFAAVSEADMLVYNTYTTNMVYGGLYGWKNDCGKAKRKGTDAGCTRSDAWHIG